ncbi:MAG: glycosyltransferase [Lachnospiraceae bacterium]|nr:glycosyltransferase [Lachnospiraceae bacterium]
MEKRVLVLDIAASKTGALSVLQDFYGYVCDRAGTDGNCSDVRWTFVTGAQGILEERPDKNVDIIIRSDVKASSARRLRFELIDGGAWINKISPDIVFSLENMIPRGIRQDIKQVLYIHQPVGFQHFKKFSLFRREEKEQALYQKFYHPLIISSAKRADRCVVQTEWMRKALIHDIGGAGDNVFKVPPSIPDLTEYVEPGAFEKKRFFYPASDLPYKNHAVIEEARKRLEADGYDPEVIYTKDKLIPREEVFEEYARSTLLFPSYLETYGMPLGEARQFGNPILAADTDFAREVLVDYGNAHFFDAFDANALAGLMKDVMEDRIGPKEPSAEKSAEDQFGELVDIILGCHGDVPFDTL